MVFLALLFFLNNKLQTNMFLHMNLCWLIITIDWYHKTNRTPMKCVTTVKPTFTIMRQVTIKTVLVYTCTYLHCMERNSNNRHMINDLLTIQKARNKVFLQIMKTIDICLVWIQTNKWLWKYCLKITICFVGTSDQRNMNALKRKFCPQYLVHNW